MNDWLAIALIAAFLLNLAFLLAIHFNVSEKPKKNFEDPAEIIRDIAAMKAHAVGMKIEDILIPVIKAELNKVVSERSRALEALALEKLIAEAKDAVSE